jgi:hypothetical protein
VLQVANFQTGALATGSTQIPTDNTIPQNTEGNEYMSLAFTPTSATSKLRIEVVVMASSSANSQWITAALFQDSTANALASAPTFQAAATAMNCISFSYWMTAGTTSATTFKVRAGGSLAGTTSFNGSAAGGVQGGVMASSITITEIAA